MYPFGIKHIKKSLLHYSISTECSIPNHSTLPTKHIIDECHRPINIICNYLNIFLVETSTSYWKVSIFRILLILLKKLSQDQIFLIAWLLLCWVILDLCLLEDWHPGARVAKWWWDQEGIERSGSWEDTEVGILEEKEG